MRLRLVTAAVVATLLAPLSPTAAVGAVVVAVALRITEVTR
jgi:hypothetical protein